MSQENLKGKTISNFSWKLMEQILSQGVSILVSIVLARILLPEDYGVVTVVLIFINICDVFIQQGFASTLIQRKEVDQKDLSSMFYASLVISMILYLILFFSAPYIQRFFGSGYDSLSAILRVMGLQIPFSAFKAIQQAIVSRELIFKKFFFATLGGKLVSGAIGIIMAIKGLGAWALAGQSLSCVVVDTLILTLIVSWHPIWYFSWTRVKPMLVFGANLVAAGLVDTIYNKLRSFVIGNKYSPADLGYYDQGDKFPALMMVTINSSLNTVLFPVLSKLQGGTKEMMQACRRSIKTSTFILFPFLAILALVSNDLIPLLLTDKWQPSIIYAQIFCAIYSFYPIYGINLQAIKAIGKGKEFFILEFSKKISGIACLIIGIPYGLMGIAISLLISTIINYFINGCAARIVLKYSWKNQILDILPNVIANIVMIITVALLPRFASHFINIVYLRVVAISVYTLVCLAIKNENLKYLNSIITDVIKKNKK